MGIIINYRYFNPEVQNEYQSFGDGMNITKVTGNANGDGRLKAYEGENEVLDMPLVSNGNEPLDWFVE